MPFEAPLLREPVLTPPLIGCAAENIENFVDTGQLNSGFVLSLVFKDVLLCATKSGIYTQSKELLLLPNANTLPAETFLFFFLPRKPSETFMSRASCTGLWRQISVALPTFISL